MPNKMCTVTLNYKIHNKMQEKKNEMPDLCKKCVSNWINQHLQANVYNVKIINVMKSQYIGKSYWCNIS